MRDADPEKRPFVADALAATPKSYLEKRSWFHLFINFRRVYEFLIVTFQLLAVWALSEVLVWDPAFRVQALSSVFLSLNLLRIVWACLAG